MQNKKSESACTASILEQVFKESPAEQTEVIYQESEEALTRFSNNAITQNVSGTLTSISIRVVKDGRTARVDTNKLDKEGIKAAIDSAMKTAKIAKPDPELQGMEGQHVYEDINSYCEETANLTPQARAEGVQRAVNACLKHGLNASGIFSSKKMKIVLANSAGLNVSYPATSVDFDLTIGSSSSDGWGQETSFSLHNIDIDRVVETAIEKCLKGQWPQTEPAEKITVVLEPAAVGDLLLFMNWLAFSTKGIQEKRSFLSGKLGERVFGENITLVDDAYEPLAPGIPFDFEGMPRERIVLIENGVFKNMIYDRRTAVIDGKKSTGHGLPEPNPMGPFALNICMAPGDSSVLEMIASTKKGILVTHFHYTNALNPTNITLTGMTRDGTFLIEDGKITKPVRNFRFTESMVETFNNVEAISKERMFVSGFFFGGSLVPAIKVKGFNFSSVTEF